MPEYDVMVMDVANIVNDAPYPNNHQFSEDYSPEAWRSLAARSINSRLPVIAQACKLRKPIDGKPYANNDQVYFVHY